MALLKSEVRSSLRSGPCEFCGKHIAEEENHFLTFFRGAFVILHEGECADIFMLTGQRQSTAEGGEG